MQVAPGMCVTSCPEACDWHRRFFVRCMHIFHSYALCLLVGVDLFVPLLGRCWLPATVLASFRLAVTDDQAVFEKCQARPDNTRMVLAGIWPWEVPG